LVEHAYGYGGSRTLVISYCIERAKSTTVVEANMEANALLVNLSDECS